MSKNVFEAFAEMNKSDTENGTKNLQISIGCLGYRHTKQGVVYEFGVPLETHLDIKIGKMQAFLLVYNVEEKNKLINQ